MPEMIFREATLNDIQPIMKVRLSVRENVLSNPDLLPRPISSTTFSIAARVGFVK
jgi:hypothetical protein